MATDYTFTFQNLNPVQTGWTGNSIQQNLADLRNTPFDPLDKSEVIEDTTAADPNATGVEIANLAQGEGMLKSVSQVLKNLQKAAKKAPDLDTLKYLNEQILEAQKEQTRIQGEVIKFGGSPAGQKKEDSGGGFFSPGHGLFGSDKPLTPAQRAELLTKRVARADSKLDIEQDKLDAHQTSIDSLQAAIDKSTDPKVIGNLQKQLAKEKEKLAKDKSKFDAQTAHRTELQNKLIAVNPPAAGTTGTTPAPGTTPAVTPAGTAAKAPNYWDELVDKALGTRAGASGWHSGGAAPAVTPAVVPATDLAAQSQITAGVTPPVTQQLAQITPAVEPIVPATGVPAATLVAQPGAPVFSGTSINPAMPVGTPFDPKDAANTLRPRQLRRQARQQLRRAGQLQPFTASGSGWTGGPAVGPVNPALPVI